MPAAALMAIPIGYARVAIDDPDVTRQLRDLKEAGCEQAFVDREFAGSDTRVAWKACLAALDQRHVLVVSRIEHLAHTLAELAEALSALGSRQAGLKVCHWDPAPSIPPGPLSEIVSRLIEFEHANRREAIRSGVQAARGEGRVGGRRHRLTPEQVSELRMLMSVPGADPVAVGRRYGVQRRTVYNYLRKAGG